MTPHKGDRRRGLSSALRTRAELDRSASGPWRVVLGVCAWLVLATGVAVAQPAPLSAEARERIPHEAEAPFVDVLTFGVGDVIFERWGHTAICLRYHEPEHSSVCFNYGVTDFADTSGLVWRFVRGNQEFWSEPSRADVLTWFYREEDRNIWIQTLMINEAQARAIETRLWKDVDEDNRGYIYDHFTDNCTTRIRDVIDDATGGALRKNSGVIYPLTLRQLGAPGLEETPLLLGATDFLLGRTMDAPLTIWEAMFHPDVLRKQIETELGVAPRVENAQQVARPVYGGPSGRVIWFGIALLVTALLALGVWKARVARAALIVASLYLGLWGLIVYVAVIVSTIPALRWNEVMCVLVPLDLMIPWLSHERRVLYARVRIVGLLMVSALCALGVLHQPLWIPILTAIMPLSLVGLFGFGERSR